jgi:predicted PurR-regulated permease PerM
MDDLTKAFAGLGCVWIVFLVILGFLWFIMPFIIDAVRSWTKKSHAELVKQTAILQRIEERLARAEASAAPPAENSSPE